MSLHKIPVNKLTPEALQGVIEEYIYRYGNDYGETEDSPEANSKQVKYKLENGLAVLIFDDETKTTNICLAGDPILKKLDASAVAATDMVHKNTSLNFIDFKKLWEIVTAQFPLGIHSPHGPRHWKQVKKNGLMLAKETGADETIVKLFSLFHDSRRENEKIDDGHGKRGSELAKLMRGIYFDLPDHSFEILLEACKYHTDGLPTSDITIATCWDADRLDLPRVGIIPDPDRMGTAPGRRLARIR